MSTQRQIDANRRNAEPSTGPVTPEGLAASSQNAVKHGLTARHMVITTEDRDEFEALRQDLLDEHQPATAVEALLVDQMVAAAWRLLRARYLETEAINLRLMDHEISRYPNPGPGLRLAHAMNEGFSNLNPLHQPGPLSGRPGAIPLPRPPRATTPPHNYQTNPIPKSDPGTRATLQ